jgi:hypothetical protein
MRADEEDAQPEPRSGQHEDRAACRSRLARSDVRPVPFANGYGQMRAAL